MFVKVISRKSYTYSDENLVTKPFSTFDSVGKQTKFGKQT